jgi:hypothetical protein
VPAELHANGMQWLIRLCVVRCYVSVMWRPGLCRLHIRLQILINHCIRLACNSVGKEELPDDDTHVSKHVGAAEKIKNARIQCICWLFINIEQKMNSTRIFKKNTCCFGSQR